jgi:hypothetical protein
MKDISQIKLTSNNIKIGRKKKKKNKTKSSHAILTVNVLRIEKEKKAKCAWVKVAASYLKKNK